MCRANRIYKNKTECNIYLWCREQKTQIIINYLFDKIDGDIKNNIIDNTYKYVVKNSIIVNNTNI